MKPQWERRPADSRGMVQSKRCVSREWSSGIEGRRPLKATGFKALNPADGARIHVHTVTTRRWSQLRSHSPKRLRHIVWIAAYCFGFHAGYESEAVSLAGSPPVEAVCGSNHALVNSHEPRVGGIKLTSNQRFGCLQPWAIICIPFGENGLRHSVAPVFFGKKLDTNLKISSPK